MNEPAKPIGATALGDVPTATAERKHPKTPCENCPYRVDAPRRHWHRSEFEGVLRGEASELGAIYNCHKHAALPEPERGFCAGWLLDQKKRGVPSIRLRLALARDPRAVDALHAVTAAGLTMFRTVKAMCRANGVRRPHDRPRDGGRRPKV